MAVTLRDIAERAGVSVVTASRALRGLTVVDPRTRQRIQEVGRELGYSQHRGVMGRLPARYRSTIQRIRVLLPFFAGLEKQMFGKPTFEAYLKGLRGAIEDSGGELLIESIENPADMMVRLRSLRYHGIVMRQTLPQAMVTQLTGMAPVVYGSGLDYYPRISCVHANESRAAAVIADRLIRLGHRHIVSLFPIWTGWWVSEWWKPWADAKSVVDLDASGMSVISARAAALSYIAESCRKSVNFMVARLGDGDNCRWPTIDAALDDLFAPGRPDRPTAIISTYVEEARHYIRLLAKRGIRVPRDVSVVAYGIRSQVEVACEQPSLAMIDLPLEACGRATLELLHRQIADPQAIPVTMLLEAPFVEGQSLGAAPLPGDSR
ncbi:MAG: LacI family DNA-binding transcriptional regulator [Phycisphaeraceae bacterium]|nr:LacI family DNA-binding transcriptional regulator [Phycisphaeraceae bacterium]